MGFFFPSFSFFLHFSKPNLPRATSNWPKPPFFQPTSRGLTASSIHQLWETNQSKQTEEEPGAVATPEEIPGLQDKWSKDKHLVFQAQMVSIRQCSLGQEARWTLPPWGVGPPLMTVLSLQAPGKEAQLLVGGSWFSCERLCWLGF